MDLDFLKPIREFLGQHIHRWYGGLLLSLVFSAAVFFAMDHETNLLTAGISSGTFLVVFGIWGIAHRLPKTPRGKVGIAIGLEVDHTDDEKQYERELIMNLEALLTQDTEGALFHLIRLPKHVAKELARDHSRAEYFQRKTRSALMIYGALARRQSNAKWNHSFRTVARVRHRQVEKDAREKFRNEISSIFPSQILSPLDNNAFSFDLISTHFDISARYMIGLAAFVSGDCAYAEKLFLDVEAKLKVLPNLPKHLEKARNSMSSNLVGLYIAWITYVYDRYFFTRDAIHLQELDLLCDKSLEREKGTPLAICAKSICEFVLRSDVSEAKHVLGRCHKRLQNDAWYYCMAFLQAYSGNLEKAQDLYMRAFRKTRRQADVPIQSEEFINIVLEKEPEKYELLFCTGLINYYAKKDNSSAERDLLSFLKSESAARYKKQSDSAKEILLKLRKQREQP